MTGRGRSSLARDALAAGLVAAAVSGLPSTVWALLRGDDPLAATRATGAMVLPDETRDAVLLAAAVPVHGAISLGWAGVLATVLPPGREPAWGAAAGLGIAVFDLGVVARVFGRSKRLAGIRALPVGPQVVDHVAFGLLVGVVLKKLGSCDRGRS